MLSHYSKYGRRSILRITGGVIGAAVAGCIDTGQNADNEFVDDEPDYEGWFDGVDHYEGTLDWRGRQEVRVMVGTGEGGVHFDPPAILIDHLTTVVWEWTGDGGDHNVIHEPESDGNAPMFESSLTDEEGATFEFTFNHEIIYTYYCEPHRDLGMRGAVTVEH